MGIFKIKLRNIVIGYALMTGGGMVTLYYFTQKSYAESDYFKLAVQKLEECPVAMESLGAPPLKIHNIHLFDPTSRVNQQKVQIKIPVTGLKTGGYLHTSSLRDTNTNKWNLKAAVLQVKGGQSFDLMNPPPPAAPAPEAPAAAAAEQTEEVMKDPWQ